MGSSWWSWYSQAEAAKSRRAKKQQGELRTGMARNSSGAEESEAVRKRGGMAKSYGRGGERRGYGEMEEKEKGRCVLKKANHNVVQEMKVIEKCVVIRTRVEP